SNRGAITERPMVAVRNIAAAVGDQYGYGPAYSYAKQAPEPSPFPPTPCVWRRVWNEHHWVRSSPFFTSPNSGCPAAGVAEPLIKSPVNHPPISLVHGLPARSQRTHRACYGPWRDPTQTSARGVFLFAANIAKLPELLRRGASPARNARPVVLVPRN